MNYDLIIIGSGPSGQKAAIAAAKLGKRVAIIERRSARLGGVCLHTGTVPSKTMREAIMYLTGYRHREVYGERFSHKRHITMDDLRKKLSQVVAHEMHVIRDQLDRNDIDMFEGQASFVDDHTIRVCKENDCLQISGDKILIACGTRPARPEHIPFDGEHVFDSDEVLLLKTKPRSMIVIGGGVIGIEYALMFAALGVKVTVIDGRERLLEFCDREIIDTLLYCARSLGIQFRLGEEVKSVQKLADHRVLVELVSQKRLVAETTLVCVGRTGDSEDLLLHNAGMLADKRGRIKCDAEHQTEVPHIYAVGDVIGFPALASTSMEQGRRAVCKMFNAPFEYSQHMPYGLFTIPEISMIGATEQQLTEQQVSYEVGIARFNEIIRGQIFGDQTGMLKILFDRDTRKVLGVHCIGELATEIVHIGQAVIALGGTIDYFCNTVFNYPTMAECYKVAAFDGINRLCLDVETVMSGQDLSAEADLLTDVQQIGCELQELQNSSNISAGV
jgi:NAD(P) transhydrogenase